MTFGKQLVKARKEKELTQEELAEELNLSRQTILRWEKNKVFPDISNLKAVASVLDVSFDYLLSETIASEKTVLTTNLLKDLIDQKVKIIFFEDVLDNYMQIYGNICTVLDVEEDILQVQFTENKEAKMKIVPVSAIQSFTFVNEGGE